MNEHDGFEALKWDAFSLGKLPRLFPLLWAQLPSLRNTTDARCKAKCFELLAGQHSSSLQQISPEAGKLPRTQLGRLTSLSLTQSYVTNTLCSVLSNLGLVAHPLQQDPQGWPGPGRFSCCCLLSRLLVLGCQGVTDRGVTHRGG